MEVRGSIWVRPDRTSAAMSAIKRRWVRVGRLIDEMRPRTHLWLVLVLSGEVPPMLVVLVGTGQWAEGMRARG